MDQQTAVWIVVLLVMVALAVGFTQPKATYMGVPVGGDSKQVMIINTVTGEAVKVCGHGACMRMNTHVLPSLAERRKTGN